MDGGASLQKSKAQWEAALDGAVENFRNLMAESSFKAWKVVQSANTPSSSSSFSPGPSVGTSRSVGPSSPARVTANKAKTRELSSLRHAKSIGDVASSLDTDDTNSAEGAASTGLPFKLGTIKSDTVVVHRRSAKGPDVYRAVAEVPFEGDPDLSAFRSVLQTSDSWSSWDRLVDSAELVEQLSPTTRINKVNYRLGWPASPRDAITISKTMADDSTLITVATSLPRSPDAPAYLRPAPPCVRSHVHLMAWCVQVIPPDSPSSNSSVKHASSSSAPSSHIKITAFWSWDLKGAWMGMPTGGLGMQLPDLVRGLVTQVKLSSAKIPSIQNYGNCVEMLSNSFDQTRDTLIAEYAIVVEDEAARQAEDRAHKDLDTLNLIRSRRKLETGVEFSLPAVEGWDVQIHLRSHTKSADSSSSWSAVAEQAVDSHRITLTLRHPRLEDADEIVKVKVSIQRVVASSGLRLNDAPFQISQVEPRTLTALSQPLLEDTASISGISVATTSTGSTSSVVAAGTAANASRSGTPSHAPAHLVNSQIRRNYIYFTSLLQEPEAKWKAVSDTRGVTVTQLDSIDPTLVVYRAEATFVGVSVWDLFSTISNPGARAFWDKNLDDAVLLTDINELSSLWHLKTKPSWPVSARDSVVIQTAYKAPASVHIFSFSTDDRSQFPQIRPVEPATIRTQIDLRGWSVEALSPTTVHITMLEQSDPKGWTSKSAIPSAMTNAVAGVGEYAINFGGPPVLTRLLGAHTTVSKYDHDKATFRIEYESDETTEDLNEAPNVECEIRCDVETWSTSLDLVVDPPPISVSCLRRHKLAQGGGGLWLTIEHVAASLEDDAARITIRKGTSREKGAVFVNGATIKVDVDDLGEQQVLQLSKQKRTKPQRVPLDLQSPAPKTGDSSSRPPSAAPSPMVLSESFAPRNVADSNPNGSVNTPAPLSVKDDEKTPGTVPVNAFFSDDKPRQPMTCALDVLFLLRRIHAERSPDPAGPPAGWALVSERNGLYVRRRLMESISSTVLVQRGDKVVQGLSAEDLLDVVSSPQCRKKWDDKIDSTTVLESYGNGATTSFITTKASFPFRGRAFHLASLTARGMPPSTLSTLTGADSVMSSSASSWSGPAVYFHASASFPEQNSRFPLANINQLGLPMGKILIDGWILETLDPYSSTSFQIPSTRCTHVVAVDYAGSLPVAVNAMWNANLPRSILLIEDFLRVRGSIPSVKTPPACLQVLGDGRDEDQGLIWTMNDPERKNLFVSANFDPATRTFAALSMHRPTKKLPEVAGLLPAAEIGSSDGDVSSSWSRPISLVRTTAAQVAPGTPSLGAAAPPLGSGGDSESGMSRATSIQSIASTSATSTPSTVRQRPSNIRSDSRRATNLILMEVEVELRHYAKGYDVQVFSELFKDASEPSASASADSLAFGKDRLASYAADKPASEGAEGVKPKSLKLSSPRSADLPVKIQIFDLPPSAVLAATLDPSARPHKHLIRVTLTTTAFLDPIEDPLTNSKSPAIPDWYNSLQERGAMLRMVIKPINSEGEGAEVASQSTHARESSSSSFVTSAGKVVVQSNGVKLDIVHVNKTSAMLQKEQVGIEPMTQLKRAAPPKTKTANKTNGDTVTASDQDDDRLPIKLRYPVALDTELIKAKESAVGASSKISSVSDGRTGDTTADAKAKEGSGHGHAADGKSKLAEISGSGASKGGIVAESTTPISASGTGTPSAPISTGAHIMNMFGAYPLSRLGSSSTPTSSLTSVSSITAKGSSVVSTSSAKTNAEALAASDRAKQSQKGKDSTGASKSQTEQQADKEGIAGASTETAANAASTAVVEAATSAGSTVLQATKTLVEALQKLTSGTQFSFATLVFVALASFLWGSLVRSMVAPTDFVLVPTKVPPFSVSGSTPESTVAKAGFNPGRSGQTPNNAATADDAVRDYLDIVSRVAAADEESSDLGSSTSALRYLKKHLFAATHNDADGTATESHIATGSNSGNGNGLVRQVQWTEIKRVLQLRTPGLGWDIVVGAVHRRPAALAQARA